MNIFRTLGSGSLSVTAMLDFSGQANTSIHGFGEEDTASISMSCITITIFCGDKTYNEIWLAPIWQFVNNPD